MTRWHYNTVSIAAGVHYTGTNKMKLSDRQKHLVKRTFLDLQPIPQFLEHPLIMHRAEGLYYWDTEGKRYFDGISGIYVASLGHRHPRVMEAMRRQMEQLTLAPPIHSIADVTLDFIERMGQVTPDNLNYVITYAGGSESIEAAIKFTRQYFKQTGRPGKHKFISRHYSYHGGTFGAMAASGTGERKSHSDPQMGGFFKVFPPNQFRDRFADWDECNRFAVQMFEDTIIQEGPDSIAGIIVEPIGNTGGIITPTPQYYQMLRNICDRYQIMLIFDEIITGYGRTGAMFAAQRYGVTPDIICSGKGLSSGAIPLGAMIAREHFAEAFNGTNSVQQHFAHGHTWANNALGCAIGKTVIDQIVEDRLDERARTLGDYLAKKLEALRRYGVVREVRGLGMLRGVELVKDTDSMQPFPELGQAMKHTAIDNGLILRINPTWFAVAPALIATESDIDELCDLIDQSMVDALAKVGTTSRRDHA